jgi:hypothetical protein
MLESVMRASIFSFALVCTASVFGQTNRFDVVITGDRVIDGSGRLPSKKPSLDLLMTF